MSKNKIVDYYKPNDERMDEYYFGHIKLLGLDKHPFGLDQDGVLRFEEIERGKAGASKIWMAHVSKDINEIWLDFQEGKYTIEEFMQFYREFGVSLSAFIDTWSSHYYAIQDAAEFQKALDKLKGTEDLEQAKQDILDTLFLATLDSVEDELIFKYRKEAKKIVNTNFGEGAWEEFINSVRNKKN
jgi:hypothetical protein